MNRLFSHSTWRYKILLHASGNKTHFACKYSIIEYVIPIVSRKHLIACELHGNFAMFNRLVPLFSRFPLVGMIPIIVWYRRIRLLQWFMAAFKWSARSVYSDLILYDGVNPIPDAVDMIDWLRTHDEHVHVTWKDIEELCAWGTSIRNASVLVCLLRHFDQLITSKYVDFSPLFVYATDAEFDVFLKVVEKYREELDISSLRPWPLLCLGTHERCVCERAALIDKIIDSAKKK